MGITVRSGVTIIDSGVPAGGTTGQALIKASSQDYDVTWGAGGGGGTPGGSSGQLQWNDGGSFAGTSALYWDSTNSRLGLGTSAPVSAFTMGSTAALTSSGGGLVMYSTVDQTTNFSRARIGLSSSNVLSYNLQNGGTGLVGYHSWQVNGTAILEIDSNQAIFSGGLLLGSDNTKDIGRLSGSPLRFRSIYLGTSIQAGAPANTAIAGSIHGYARTASTIASVFQGTASQTANLTEWWNSAGTVLTAVDKNGGIVPASMTDATAANGTIYYSTTASKLVYKDGGGVVNALY